MAKTKKKAKKVSKRAPKKKVKKVVKATKKKATKKVSKRETAAARAGKKKAARGKLVGRKKYPRRRTDFDVKITPTMAKAMLGDNWEGNRNIRPTRVDLLAGILRRDTWERTGEAITYDWFGNMINGQHRLAAIIKTGISATADITYGVPPGAFDVIDTGAPRQLYDVLPVQYPKQVSALYRLFLDFVGTSGSGYTSFGRRSGTAFREDRAGAVKWAMQNEKLTTKIIDVCFLEPDARLLLRPPAIFHAFYFWVARKSPREADEFFRTLIDGVAFEGGKSNPIYQLRQTIVQFNDKYRTKRGASVPLWMLGGMLIKAWNAWMERGQIKQLRMIATEKWPELTKRTSRARTARAAA